MRKPIFKFAIREDLKDSEISFLPTRATPRSAGWDVRAALPDGYKLYIYPYQHVLIPLGFRSFCPDGWWFELKPRSSTFAKKHLNCLYGTIDEDFEGQLMLAVQYMPKADVTEALTIEFGDALGQIIPVRRQDMIVEKVSNEEYDALCKKRNAERGAGGFGSTSDKHV